MLTRLTRRVVDAMGGLKTKVRDRTRSIKKKVMAIAISSRRKGPEGEGIRGT